MRRKMKSRMRIFSLLLTLISISSAAPARNLGWDPPKTWIFGVGVLGWKHSEMFGSFPLKNRRDTALVDFFRRNGVPDSHIVYLRDREATQARIDTAFSEQLKKLGPEDLLIVYYAGHGTQSDQEDDVFLASYD